MTINFVNRLRLCSNKRVSCALQIVWGSIYAFCGAAQFVAGIYYMLELPMFQLGSNIWTGAWNLFSGVAIILMGSSKKVSVVKTQAFLILSLLVTVFNLVNLVILEVGEWRGFLSPSDKEFIQELEELVYTAYICTTVATVTAMIASFLASQHAFFFLRLLTDRNETVNNGRVVSYHNSTMIQTDTDGIMCTKKNNNSDHNDLNLKTPVGPESHYPWIYNNRHSNSPAIHSLDRPTSTSVKRSLSMLNGQCKLFSTSSPAETKSGLSPVPWIVKQTTDKGREPMRHAIIRRHRSMYIHPRATENMPLGPPHKGDYSSSTVNGKSDVRSTVTLKRSQTTVGQYSWKYRSVQMPSVMPQHATMNYATLGPSRLDNSHHCTIQRSTSRCRNPNYEDICEFQAGPSFDLPNRGQMCRKQNDFGRNGPTQYVMERNEPRKLIRNMQDEMSNDRCGDNIQYQAIEGFVTITRPGGHQDNSEQYLSAENLLSDPSYGMARNGSMGSFSSVGLDHFGGGIVPTSHGFAELYKSHEMVINPPSSHANHQSNEAIKKIVPNISKSNSRVSSSGKLRLRVESFRKSSSGTQTDISVTRVKKRPYNQEQQQQQQKYMGQFKKHAAPHKPARKHKPRSSNDSVGLSTNASTRSDGSASPANSSTSGYSSPAAGGLRSKESSPCGTKVPSSPQSLERETVNEDDNNSNENDNKEEEEEEEEDNSRITVIQIVPAASATTSVTDSNPTTSIDDDKQQHQWWQQQRRELPRISPPKRMLPVCSQALTDTQQTLSQLQRLYNSRSNLPRPVTSSQFGRVPLPPVPELDRSDHERESMSPLPAAAAAATFTNINHSRIPVRLLPSPLTTPVQPVSAGGRTYQRPRRHKELPSIPIGHFGRVRRPGRSSSEDVDLGDDERAAAAAVDEYLQDDKLKTLLSILETGNGMDTSTASDETSRWFRTRKYNS